MDHRTAVEMAKDAPANYLTEILLYLLERVDTIGELASYRDTAITRHKMDFDRRLDKLERGL